MLSCALGAGPAGAPKSIFDDDYVGTETAPPRKPKPAEVSPPPPVDEPEPVRPAAPAPTPVPPPTPEPVVKSAVPTAEQQAQADKLVKELFAPQMTDRSRVARRGLADLLITKAAQSADDPAVRYVMLAQARDFAADAGDIRLSLRAVAALEEAYEVNGTGMRVDAFLRAKTRLADPIDNAAAVSEGLQLIEDLIRVAEYKRLAVVAPIVRSAAIKGDNKSLAGSVRLITADAEALAAEFEKTKQAADVLKETPDDPALNVTVGRFLCLFRDDWRGGLPKLLKGAPTDPLHKLASLEIASAKSPAVRKQLAEGWWAFAEANRNAPLVMKKAQRRACAWYANILDSLTGLDKVVAQKRMSEARANGVDVKAAPDPDGKSAAKVNATTPK